MSLEIEGKLKKILPMVTGQGKNGPWKKQEFVIETDGQFPKSAVFNLWGDKVASLQGLNPGDLVRVSFDVESREYNERWYTDLKAWRLEPITTAPGQQTGGASAPATSRPASSRQSAPPANYSSPAPETPPLPDQEDDLPF